MIEIEIIEFIFIQDELSVLCVLIELCNVGFVLFLDDFGSGFLLLSYLCIFQFDVIKIDCFLVKDIYCLIKVLLLLLGLVKMFNSLQYKVLVEGVDNLVYILFMEDMGILVYQGFLFEKFIFYDQFIYKYVYSLIMLED